MAKSRIFIRDFVKQQEFHFYQAAGVNDIHATSSFGLKKKKLTPGMVSLFMAQRTNTGPITIQIDDLEPVPGLQQDGSPFKGYELLKDNPYIWVYDGESFKILNQGSFTSEDYAELIEKIEAVGKEVTTLNNELKNTNKKLMEYLDLVSSQEKIMLGEGFHSEDHPEYDQEGEYEDGTVVTADGNYGIVSGGNLIMTDYKIKVKQESVKHD